MASVPAEVAVCEVETTVLDGTAELVDGVGVDSGVFEKLAIDDGVVADEVEAAELADAPVPMGTFCLRWRAASTSIAHTVTAKSARKK